MSKAYIKILGVMLITLIAGGVVMYFSSSKESSVVEEPYMVPPLTKHYRNETLRFSVKTPENFSARELPPDELGATTLVFEDTEGNGVQVYATPVEEEERNLTATALQTGWPELQVREPQVVEIGATHTGVAFKSDNSAFGGDSREVWLYFRNTLFQISTYAKHDELLQKMFSTWEFF